MVRTRGDWTNGYRYLPPQPRSRENARQIPRQYATIHAVSSLFQIEIMADDSRVVTFCNTYDRLMEQVRARLRSGEFTERSLARRLGISQPHVNNVLRGRRKFSPKIADHLLKYLHCSLLDLYADGELENHLARRLISPDHYRWPR